MRRGIVILLSLALTVALFAGTNAALKGMNVLPNSKFGTEQMIANPSDLPLAGSRNPRTGDDVIISEGFETVADDALPAGWTQVDVDNGSCAQFAGALSRWRARTYNPHTGTKIAFNHYNDSAVPNNDWLILPQQNLTGTITLSYWIASQDADYLESYEVKVSTTGTQPANFTNLIFSATDIPTTWTQHTHDLSAYAGAPFYIAFHYNSTDEFVIKLDDILLEAGASTRGALSGTVTDQLNGSPLANVNVEVVGASATTTTAANGTYFLANVMADTYMVRFTKTGYQLVEQTNVIIVTNDTTTLNVAMPRSTNALEEDFEGVADDALPTGWTQVDVDNGTCAQFAGALSRWRARTYNPHGGAKIAFNHYNDAALPNNDWLILPQQNLTGAISLSYWIASQDASYLESYEVKVSTTGTQPANFTNLIFSATDIPTTWTQHTHDLSAYAGAPFYIAFHHNSADEFVIKLDDLTLSGSSQPVGTIRGVVTNSLNSTPIQNVNVAVLTTALTATTNAAGAYIFTSVTPGTYTLRFTKANFDTLEVEGVIVAASDTVDVDVAMDPADAADDINLQPASFAFYGNYPNPFNARTEFRFSTERVGQVELVLYNVAGQEVARVVNEVMGTGMHTVAFDAANLPTGMYLARLTAAGHTAIQKMMLLK